MATANTFPWQFAAREDTGMRGGFLISHHLHLGPEDQACPSTAVRSGGAELEVLEQSWELQKPPERVKHFWIEL